MLTRIILLISFFVSANVYGYECNRELDELSNEYETKIICNIRQTSLMSSNISGISASQNLINNATPYIKKFFHSYEHRFIRENLKQLTLFHSLHFRGSPVGGLSNGYCVYLDLDNYSDPDETYLEILHHEFSSNIYKRASYFRLREWRNYSDIYDTSIEFLKKCLDNYTFSEQASEYVKKNGFIKNYALTNPENDFNIYASELFRNTRRLQELRRIYPKINQKVNLLKQIYRDEGFTGRFPDET